MKRLGILLSVLLFVATVAGCGSGGTGKASGSQSGFCAALSAILDVGSADFTSPDKVRSAAEAARPLLEKARAEAPSEITADVDAVTSQAKGMLDVAAKYGYDASRLTEATPAEQKQLTDGLDALSGRAGSPLDHIRAYGEKNCGLTASSLNLPTQPTSTTSAPR